MGVGTGPRRRGAAIRGGAALALGLLAAGCAAPEPIGIEERHALVKGDYEKLFAGQEPVAAPISLGEAMARAVKYNLDQRLALMEEALQARQLDVSNLDMLPKLVANAGYNTRSRDNLTVSRNIRTGVTSLDPSESTDRSLVRSDLTFTWNILDFGVSYFQARQQADRAMVARERKRRIVNSIIQQVRSAFWLAATAERLADRIDPVLAEAYEALEDARSVEEQRLQAPMESLQFQKTLIEIIRQLETVQQDLAIAKAQLAALMNLPLGSQYSLALPTDFKREIPRMDVPIETMEMAALLHRPDLQEEHYQRRINANEVRKAMVRMLPGISFTAGYNYDSNSYLIHNTWAEAGTRVAYNLFTLLSGPSAVRAAESQVDVGEQRRLALSMATLTQVHIAFHQYNRSRKAYEQARMLDDIERRMNDSVQSAAVENAESALERIRSAASAINAELARDRAYAELQNALSSLYVTLGLDALPETSDSHSIADLAVAFQRVADDWQAGRVTINLPQPPPEPDPQPAEPQPAESAPPNIAGEAKCADCAPPS